ncbi:sigma-70 family RNA polymerase sigma factor [bacterium]|nr:sigma-70 family RNA polymerase sigma factor [bacterium]
MTDDQALVQDAQNGQRNAFRRLVEKHKQRVYFIALDLMGNHTDAEDMSQEVFIKAYRSLSRFRGDAQFSSWLHRITVNTCIDHRRKKWWQLRKAQKSMKNDDTNMLDNIPAGNPGPEQLTDDGLIQARIRNALDGLSQRERDIFLLRHDHDMALSDIAESLNISLGTVKSTLFNALRKLRKELAPLRRELGWEA